MVTKKPKGLGRGLEALLGPKVDESAAQSGEGAGPNPGLPASLMLGDMVLSCDEPAVLVAHSLGCILTAAWAARSRNTQRVKAALLVAPGDVERPQVRELLPSWSPIELQALPFPAVLLASHTDPYCAFERAHLFAHAWNAQFMDYGDCGHINADSGLASWPEGHVLLQDLMKD